MPVVREGQGGFRDLDPAGRELCRWGPPMACSEMQAGQVCQFVIQLYTPWHLRWFILTSLETDDTTKISRYSSLRSSARGENSEVKPDPA